MVSLLVRNGTDACSDHLSGESVEYLSVFAVCHDRTGGPDIAPESLLMQGQDVPGLQESPGRI